MLKFTSSTKYYLRSNPTDMRKGREALAGIVRAEMKHSPKSYDKAFIFYSKDYKKVKVLHYDLNGYVMYEKWFDNGRFLKPEFGRMLSCHEISRETLILLLSTAIQTKIAI